MARKQGHYVFLCTGRSYGMLLPLLKYGFDGVITGAGGYIECHKVLKKVADDIYPSVQEDGILHVFSKHLFYINQEIIDKTFYKVLTIVWLSCMIILSKIFCENL